MPENPHDPPETIATGGPVPSGAPAVAPGTRIGGYVVESTIGVGGMGVVLRARDLELGRSVALKLIAPALASDPRFRELFIRESLAAAAVEHPNVLPVHRAGQDGEHLFIAMRLVEGCGLDELVTTEGRLDPGRAARIVAEAAAALDAAHARGLVHRDVKPANILIADPGGAEHVYLADFGVSVSPRGRAGRDGRSPGTPAYLAPEQVDGGPLGPQADVWALGCVLFEALTGRRAFEAGAPAAGRTGPPRPSEIAPDLPPEADDVILRALAPRPGDRFASAGELGRAALALRHDVVLVHRAEDGAAVAELARGLADAGIRPAPSVAAGSADALGGIRWAGACAVVVGAAGLGDWVSAPLTLAEDAAARDRSHRIFSVLLPGAPDPLSAEMAFLAVHPWVDLRAGADDADAVADLVRALGGDTRRPPLPLVGAEACPYRGLARFEQEHAVLFHGREAEVARALALLQDGRFLAILGPSGSGKSSLLRAGVIPALAGGAFPGADHSPVALLTPGANPLGALAAELERLLGVPAGAAEDELAADRTALDGIARDAFAARDADERLVIAIDQLEEAFTMAPPEARGSLLDNLAHAATIPGGRVVVLATMRADFFPRLAEHPRLATAVASRQLILGPLDATGLRRAIEEPARAAGLELEDGLSRRLQADVGDRAEALPLLEHVLEEIWRRRRGRVLTLEAYAASGGLEGSLAKRANEVFERLSEREKPLARAILLRLTQPGEGRDDTRRRASIEELRSSAADPADAQRVIDALASARLLSLGRDEATGTPTVEVVHEALIRGWPRLRRWIDEDRERLRLLRRLTEAAQEWDATGRDPEMLARGARLAAWSEVPPGDVTSLERAYLDASAGAADAERRVRRRRIRVAFAALGIVVAVVATAAVIAFQERSTAEEQRDIARSRGLAVNAATALEDDPELALLLAREADAVSATQPAEEQLRQATEEMRLVAAIPATDGDAYGVAWLPGGRQLAVGTGGGQVEILEADGGGRAATLTGLTDNVSRVVVREDGRVAAIDDAGAVALWSPPAPRPVWRRVVSDGELHAVAFSADGRRLATGGDDGVLRIIDARSGDVLRELSGHTDRISGLDWGPDGTLASGGFDTTLRVWDLATGRSRIVGRNRDSVVDVDWSPDGRLLADAGEDLDAGSYVWDPRGGRPAFLPGGKGATSYGVRFSPDGRFVAVASADSLVRVHNRSGGEPILTLRPSEGTVNAVAWRPDGRVLASTDTGGFIRLWDTAPERERTLLTGHTAGVLGADWSRDGARIVTGSNDHTVRLWSPARGPAQRVLRGHDDEVWGAAFSPDGRRVVTGSLDATVRVWDVASGRTLRTMRGHEGLVWDAAWSPRGDRVASAGVDGTARVWDPRTGRAVAVLRGHDSLVWGVRFDRAGEHVVTGGQDGTVRVWRASGGPALAVLSGADGAVWRPSFSPDGRLVAGVGDDGVIRIWDWRSRDLVVALRGHVGRGFDAVFSPDGRLLASGGEDATVRIWDWRRGAALAVLRGHTNSALRIVWSPDGRRVLSTSDDGDARIWRCGTCGALDEVRALARARTVRDFTPEERAAFLPDG